MSSVTVTELQKFNLLLFW